MTITKKIAMMFCLMMGSALFVRTLDTLILNVGVLDIVSYTLAILLLIGGVYLIIHIKEKV